MRMRTILLIPLLASCWNSKPAVEPVRVIDGVKVEIASVNLAEDCPEAKAAAADEPAASKVAPGSAVDMGDRACEQTFVQLQLSSTGQGASKITIKKVELLDDQQKVLGELTSREPSLWNDSGTYTPWDESLVAGKAVQASYKLSAPKWGPGGRDTAAGKTFHVRVTLVVGDKERTVERATTMPAMMEPDVVT